MEKKTKILIIGSKGFIGSHLVNYLSKIYQVFGADVLPDTAPDYYYLDKTNIDFNFIFKDCKFDLCINASGNGSVPVSINEPLLDFELNTFNTIKILEAIRIYNFNCKYINFSSAAVYGNPQFSPINENSVIEPVSPYGWHKLFAEKICFEYYILYNIRSINLRIFSVYGEGLKKQLFWDIFRKSLNDNTITLFGTGKETRDFIYINDLLHGIECIIKSAVFDGSIINVGSGIETNIEVAAKILCSYLNPDINIKFNNKTKPGDPINWCADISNLNRLGFVSKTSIEEGLANTALWLKQNG